MNPVIMHINYCEGKGGLSPTIATIDGVCKKAATLGYDGIEFRGNVPGNLSGLSFEDYVKQIGEAKEKYGLSEILFGVDARECVEKDEAARKAAAARIEEKLSLFKKYCGTTVCNGSASLVLSRFPTAPADKYEFAGSAVATQEEWDLTVDFYQKLGKKLEGLGIRIGFETHMKTIHDLPSSAKKLVDLIDSPAIGINLDYGNTVYFPDIPSVEEAIDICGDKLFYVHLKNSVEEPTSGRRIPVALSEGTINHRLYLSKLKKVGFEGPIAIEAPRDGDREWFAKSDIEYYKAICKEIF